IRDLKATSIVLPGGRKVRLDDLATVEDSIEEPRTFARFNGESVVAFSVSRGSGASDAEVAAGVEKKIAEFAESYPDIQFQEIDSSVAATRGSYASAMHTLMEGAALAVIVVFLFLRDWRATLIAAVALPLSVFPTFW
ncbi:efflux RND transporter permease subunit, partial [Acinetobacter baumannii]